MAVRNDETDKEDETPASTMAWKKSEKDGQKSEGCPCTILQGDAQGGLSEVNLNFMKLQGTVEFLSAVGKMYRSFRIHQKHSFFGNPCLLTSMKLISSPLPIMSTVQLMKSKTSLGKNINKWPR
ncbi:hypothetical protein OS493_028539 [Desmophyllum pertusum]|uniref:Uncharacterized protein n=1 Tax=Desmophyllum pertusum TaxID=174260 RepID=A0A9W9Z9X2_9CNID|nr:hypothetical protein OS493_028539 [Desmophyllum pertusum]